MTTIFSRRIDWMLLTIGSYRNSKKKCVKLFKFKKKGEGTMEKAEIKLETKMH